MTCAAISCVRTVRARGLCIGHYNKEHGSKLPCSFAGCRSLVRARGLCASHWSQWSRGKVLVTLIDLSLTPSERLWAKVDKEHSLVHPMHGQCWEWTGSTHKNSGHGQIGVDGALEYTHRLSWELLNGPILNPSLFVCHHCDNPPCVRPSHLFLGTAADNSADMVKKDRHQRGTRAPGAKLTDNDVVDIRTLTAFGAERSELAAAFGVSRSAISLIVTRERWKHVAA